MERIAVHAIVGLSKLAASYAGKRLQILYCLDDHIKRLRVYVLPSMNIYISHIEDAELKKMLEASPTDPRPQEDPSLQNFKDLASDIEDILDEVSIRAELYQLSNTSSRRALNFCCEPVCCCFATCCFDYSSSSRSDRRCKFSVAFYTRVALRINDIYIQLEKIAQSKEIQKHLLPDTSPSENSSLIAFDDETYERKNRETTSLANRGFKMIGRDGVKEDILRKLQNAESNLLVIPIIGMGGVGKSTMARSVFNDATEKKEFQFMKWVFVGKNFNAASLLKEGILDDPQLVGNLEHINDKVKEKVKGNKFLIVLDDVWSDDQGQWNHLLTPLTHDGDCSRILVTTRNGEVARAACNNLVYHVKLEPLDYESCVDLFEQYAFPNGVQKEHKNLRKIGREIVGKLQGHPLAAKAMGSSLFGETEESEWMKIRNSKSWRQGVKNLDDIVQSTMLLSYYRLPYHLKQCFRMCSIFKKGERIPKFLLIEMWIAHGYVSDPTRPLKDTGSEYMDYLCSTSLFQNDSVYDCGFEDHYYLLSGEHMYLCYDHGQIKVHEFIHDLAQLISRGEAFSIMPREFLEEGINSNGENPKYSLDLSLVEKTILTQQPSKASMNQGKRIRHLAIYGRRFAHSNFIDWKLLSNIIDWKSLRTLIVHDVHVPRSVQIQQRSIRVLISNKIDQFKDFKNVIHLRILRYKNLSYLDRTGLQYVTKLTKLRVLDIEPDLPLIKDVGKLASLQYMQRFHVHDKDGYRIKELKRLQLHGRLTIQNLEKVKGGCMEAKEAMLDKKEHLTDLELIWSDGEYDDDNMSNHEEVLKGLCPHQNLKKLCVEGFAGRQCGLALYDYNSMVSILLHKCQNLVELPQLGQMSGLEYLKISKLDKLRKVTRQFYCSLGHDIAVVFPSLKVLQFEDMRKWKEWDGLDDQDNNKLKFFPSLQTLEIRHCGKLRGIPHLPSSINSLKLAFVGLTTISNFWGCKGGLHDQQQPTLLRELYINNCDSLKTTGECLLEHPTSVESFNIKYCDSLTEISASKHFSLVGGVDLNYCKNLKTLKLSGAGTVTDLSIFKCDILSDVSLGSPALSSRVSLDVTSVVPETLQRHAPPHVMDLTADSCESSEPIKSIKNGISAIHVAPDSSGVIQYPLRNVKVLNTDIWDVLRFVCPKKLKVFNLQGNGTYSYRNAYSYEEKQWWQSLTSLKTLELLAADDLLGSACFWESLQHIPFLEELTLCACLVIGALKEMDLPRSLRTLQFHWCPHLEKRYGYEGQGRDIMLSHIPQLRIV